MEKTILEQIGITQDELIDRIVDRVLGMTAGYNQTGEDTYDEIPFSKVIDSKIEKALGDIVEKARESIQDKIDKIVTEKIEAVFSMPFQPVNRFGEKTGTETTIKELIANEATNYWTARVDPSTGKTPDRYASDHTERAVFYARKVMTEFYDKELVKIVKKMAEDLKNRIPETIGQEITKTVTNFLK